MHSRGAKTWQDSNQHLEIPSPAPNPRKNLIFMDIQKKEPQKSMFPKVAETGQPI